MFLTAAGDLLPLGHEAGKRRYKDNLGICPQVGQLQVTWSRSQGYPQTCLGEDGEAVKFPRRRDQGAAAEAVI